MCGCLLLFFVTCCVVKSEVLCDCVIGMNKILVGSEDDGM